MRPRFDWRMWLILWIASTIGLLAVVPYSLALQGMTLDRLAAMSPMPVPLLLAIQLGFQALLFGILVAIGLWLAARIGLGQPLLQSLLDRKPITVSWRRNFLVAIALGVLSAVLIIALDVLVFSPLLSKELGGAAQGLQAGATRPTWWQGLLASLYGGIDEELLLRLFLMSLLAFIGKFVSNTPEGTPTLTVLWIANILAAVLFGLGHLPATQAILPLTPLVVARAIVLNGLAGIAFGYLYFTRGLEAAMLSHFSADIVLHVIFAI